MLTRHKESFPVAVASNLLGFTIPDYMEKFRSFADIIGIEIPVMTFKELSVTFGCAHAVDFCEQLKSEVQVKAQVVEVKDIDWKSQDAIFAVFFTVLKTMKVSTSEKVKTELGVGTRKYRFYCNQIENLGSLFLKSIKEALKGKSVGKVSNTTTVSKKKKKRYVTGINPMVIHID
jgi:hypothetical protein